MKSISISSSRLIVLVSVCLLLFYNFAFFSNVSDVYPVSIKNIGFLVSLAFFFGSITIILLALVCYKHTIKPALIIVLMTSAATSYFMDSYNTVFDDIMIDNIIKTDVAEAGDLFSLRFLAYMLVLGVIPAGLVYKVKITHKRRSKEVLAKLKLILVSFFIAITSILLFSDYYASFFREHKSLRYYTNPSYYIYSSGKYLGGLLSTAAAPGAITQLAEDALIPLSDIHRELVILVVGETARADRFSLNGYQRKTNPLLEKKDVITFTNFWSCGTSTAYSLPCIFSGSAQAQFNISTANNTENVIDVLHEAGVNVLWLDNNSDSKGVALRVPYQSYKTADINPVCDTECRDIGMLTHLQTYIDEHPKGDIFIVLHQMGNHGPAYYKRYPDEFEVFKPACKTNQLEECSREEINNAYDNAILYTDYFLSKTIELLEPNTKQFEVSMIYVSDHGESLGENGIYLHGLPNMIAPDVQRHVPMVIWLGYSYDQNEINLDLLKQRTNERLSHDNIFHTLLGLMEVKTTSYDETMDLIEHHDEHP